MSVASHDSGDGGENIWPLNPTGLAMYKGSLVAIKNITYPRKVREITRATKIEMKNVSRQKQNRQTYYHCLNYQSTLRLIFTFCLNYKAKSSLTDLFCILLSAIQNVHLDNGLFFH